MCVREGREEGERGEGEGWKEGGRGEAEGERESGRDGEREEGMERGRKGGECDMRGVLENEGERRG